MNFKQQRMIGARFLWTAACWFAFLSLLHSQQPAASPLDWSSFRRQVLDHHPLALQADLQRDLAAAALLRARGGFDPQTYADFSVKAYGGKNYYQYGEAGVKWPTWAGLEVKGAYQQARGEYLNPERQLPAAGQAVVGVEWAVGQGLLFDERRAALRQGKIGLEQAAAEWSAARNDLLFDAAQAYWAWVIADNQLSIYALALEQAQLRLQGLRESVLQGDKPAIDTTETLLQVQTRLLDLNFAQLERQNAALTLATFLWQPNQQPIGPEALAPAPFLLADTFETDGYETEALVQQARQQHPELRLYAAKARNLEVESRLKNEKRKPQLDLNYNLLGNGWSFFPTATADGPAMLANDIKWGINFSYPLLNRKARGDWQVTEIKRTQNDQAWRQKRQEVEAQVRQYANELDYYGRQLPLYRDFTANYRLLLEAEIERFRQGESSVFLINAREQRWLDAQIKYLKVLGDYRKAKVGLRWAAGTADGF